jgi:hypothetical protein
MKYILNGNINGIQYTCINIQITHLQMFKFPTPYQGDRKNSNPLQEILQFFFITNNLHYR